ncbi:U-box domain-containing protein 11 [Aegilops tauschii subsp. strangulata]|nr:U-box domain-containing protein 11 [Aegilops tauschii subsp. strangulata]
MAATAGAAAEIVREIAAVGAADLAAAPEPLRADCLRLARKVSLLTHLVAEVAEAAGEDGAAGPEAAAWVADLLRALQAARRFVALGRVPALHTGAADQDVNDKNIAVQFKYVTWQLQAALTNLPHSCFQISDEVQEEVDLVRGQLKREMEKKGALDLNIFSKIHDILAHHVDNVGSQSEEPHSQPETLSLENLSSDHLELQHVALLISEISGISKSDIKKITSELIEGLENARVDDSAKPTNGDSKTSDEAKDSPDSVKKPDTVAMPEDFRCPISLELMRDPVIVSTGQTYERAFIQRWIDGGNRTCPKTQQKLQNLTLTPNYVLRSLILQWCEEKGIEPPTRSKYEGSSVEVGEDRLAIEALVRNLSCSSLDERKSAAAEIRSLAKKSTDNRMLLAESGAIPALVKLLSSKDPKTQEHAVTSLLNLSIYDQNKELIVVGGAIVPIIQVLRTGSMEARENAAAAIFSLSLIDDNKIMIGSTPGAIEALVELLKSGSSRGRKDAATALFNLCIYQANKVRAVRAGILSPLVQMLQDSSSAGATDEALTILSVLVSHHECKTAIAKAHTIPFLIDLLRSSQARNKENAAAILLALCKKDAQNLACIGRLGAQIPLTELSKTGSDRAKRKATSLLEHLSKLQVL